MHKPMEHDELSTNLRSPDYKTRLTATQTLTTHWQNKNYTLIHLIPSLLSQPNIVIVDTLLTAILSFNVPHDVTALSVVTHLSTNKTILRNKIVTLALGLDHKAVLNAVKPQLLDKNVKLVVSTAELVCKLDFSRLVRIDFGEIGVMLRHNDSSVRKGGVEIAVRWYGVVGDDVFGCVGDINSILMEDLKRRIENEKAVIENNYLSTEEESLRSKKKNCLVNNGKLCSNNSETKSKNINSVNNEVSSINRETSSKNKNIVLNNEASSKNTNSVDKKTSSKNKNIWLNNETSSKNTNSVDKETSSKNTNSVDKETSSKNKNDELNSSSKKKTTQSNNNSTIKEKYPLLFHSDWKIRLECINSIPFSEVGDELDNFIISHNEVVHQCCCRLLMLISREERIIEYSLSKITEPKMKDCILQRLRTIDNNLVLKKLLFFAKSKTGRIFIEAVNLLGSLGKRDWIATELLGLNIKGKEKDAVKKYNELMDVCVAEELSNLSIIVENRKEVENIREIENMGDVENMRGVELVKGENRIDIKEIDDNKRMENNKRMYDKEISSNKGIGSNKEMENNKEMNDNKRMENNKVTESQGRVENNKEIENSKVAQNNKAIENTKEAEKNTGFETNKSIKLVEENSKPVKKRLSEDSFVSKNYVLNDFVIFNSNRTKDFSGCSFTYKMNKLLKKPSNINLLLNYDVLKISDFLLKFYVESGVELTTFLDYLRRNKYVLCPEEAKLLLLNRDEPLDCLYPATKLFLLCQRIMHCNPTRVCAAVDALIVKYGMFRGDRNAYHKILRVLNNPIFMKNFVMVCTEFIGVENEFFSPLPKRFRNDYDRNDINRNDPDINNIIGNQLMGNDTNINDFVCGKNYGINEMDISIDEKKQVVANQITNNNLQYVNTDLLSKKQQDLDNIELGNGLDNKQLDTRKVAIIKNTALKTCDESHKKVEILKYSDPKKIKELIMQNKEHIVNISNSLVNKILLLDHNDDVADIYLLLSRDVNFIKELNVKILVRLNKYLIGRLDTGGIYGEIITNICINATPFKIFNAYLELLLDNSTVDVAKKLLWRHSKLKNYYSSSQNIVDALCIFYTNKSLKVDDHGLMQCTRLHLNELISHYGNEILKLKMDKLLVDYCEVILGEGSL